MVEETDVSLRASFLIPKSHICNTVYIGPGPININHKTNLGKKPNSIYYFDLLRKIWRRFEDLSDEDKAEVALEAKKWAREKQLWIHQYSLPE